MRMGAARCGQGPLRLCFAGVLLLHYQGAEASQQHEVHQFDCEAALNNWHRAWSEEKKHWCCQTAGLGCHDDRFDCQVGYDNRENEWPAEKQEWCCKHEHLGCPKKSVSLYDCNDRREDWEASWPEKKKQWCWKHEVLLRLQGSQKKTETYDCVAGYSNWRTEWTSGKKQWCCKYRGLGCASDPYDCKAGYNDWEMGWSTKKKAWCCENRHQGCSKKQEIEFADPKHNGDLEGVYFRKKFALPSSLLTQGPAAQKVPSVTCAALSFVVSLAIASAMVRSCHRAHVMRREAAAMMELPLAAAESQLSSQKAAYMELGTDAAGPVE